MVQTVIEGILGNNKFYTENYIRDTILLVKSIVIKNHKEARLYNDYLEKKYPGYVAESNARTWRYYKHLQGLYHEKDTPIEIASVDNGLTIVLNHTEMAIHKRTKQEILKFGLYYEEIIKKYPEQELFVRSVVTDRVISDIEVILDAPEYTIVSCNKGYLEENEDDVIPDLQTRIDNYRSIWLIPYYAMANNLFLAAQYNNFYNFLVTSLLAIRLENSKTMRAHSYHIRLYLASHHYLDEQMLFLSRRQTLFLYRNLLYLNNHSGRNSTFQTLIDELFNENNISVVNYVYNQRNQLSLDYDMEYVYSQKLLNSKDLVYQKNDMSLEYIAGKERVLAPGNAKEYDFNKHHIDKKHRNSLLSSLLSKDLETILVDETDSVRYKLLDILVDYWAYFIKNGKMDFLVDITDPVTNAVHRLNTKDLFKFFTICLYKTHGQVIDVFPDYRIKRVFAPTLASDEQLWKLFFELRIPHKDYIRTIKDAIPIYSQLMTSFQFSEFVNGIYQLEMGLWLLLANYSDYETEGQFAMLIDRLHVTELYTFRDETVDEFLGRVGITDPRNYDSETLKGYSFSILDNVFDKRLSFLNRLKKLQDALATVFFKFNSYTVQLINNYFSDSPILAGPKDVRYTDDYLAKWELEFNIINNFDESFRAVGRHRIDFLLKAVVDFWHDYKYKVCIDLPGVVDIDIDASYKANVELMTSIQVIDVPHVETKSGETSLFDPTVKILDHWNKLSTNVDINSTIDVSAGLAFTETLGKIIPLGIEFSLDNNNWMVSEPSQSDLIFLALNQ